MQASFLSGVKLKQVNVVEKHRDNFKEIIQQEDSQNKRLRAVDLESWYYKIIPFTYETYFISLSMEEAKNMIKEFYTLKANPSAAGWKENSILHDLYCKIENLMKEKSLSVVFAKLSSRSPKDSRICQQKAQEMALLRLKSLAKTKELTTNDLVQEIMRAGIESLQTTNAKEILDSFLTSDRVCADDLPLALQFPSRWTQHIVIRKWVSVPIQFEFRAFIMDNRMTALSQYFNNCFFPDVLNAKEKILKIIQDLFESVRGLLDIDPPEYVLDIAVQLEEEKAYVIELNPFGRPNGMGTGTCLFDNSKEEDLKILFGDSEFEFRVEEAPTSVSASKYIRGEWKTFFAENNLI